MPKATKLYHSILYLSQFLIDEQSLESLTSKTPKILDTLNIKNDLRITIVDKLDNLLNDLKQAKLKGDWLTISKSIRKFIHRFLILFGGLGIVGLLKSLILKSRFDIGEVNTLSLSFAGISSLIPLVKLLIDKIYQNDSTLVIATAIVSYLGVSILPKESGDYISAYSVSYGFESLLSSNKYGKKLLKPGVLVPLALIGLYHNYIIHPQNVPPIYAKLLNYMNKDLFESKPSYITRWASTDQIILSIKESAILNDRTSSSMLSNSSIKEIVEYQPHPLHSNKVLCLTNPSTPSVLKVLSRYIPSKFIKLFVIGFPIVFLYQRLKSSLKDGESNYEVLKEALKKTAKLSTLLVAIFSTLFYLTVRNNNTRTPINNFKYIGGLSGLWTGLFLKEENELTKTLLRGSFISVKRTVEQKYNLHNLDSILTSVGLGFLAQLITNGESDLIPSRTQRTLKLMGLF